MSTFRKSIAIFYPSFTGGGAEAVGLWMLEALKGKYDLTLFTVADIDFDRLNVMYGTNLSREMVKVRPLVSQRFNPLYYKLIANNRSARMLSFHSLIRYFKQHSHEYDLVMSAYNAVDLGEPGMQYIHWVNVIEGNLVGRLISQFSSDQLKQNISFANSYYVAERVKATYGIEASVIYPPVTLDPADSDWSQRENAFICSGRLVETKQPHKVIQIIDEVRKCGFDVKLHLTGGGGGVYGHRYVQMIKKMAEQRDWLTIHENLKYKDYVNLLFQCKYGIHFKKEPFGISVAEMVKAGAIPFVRKVGGQREIVGEQHQDLFFGSQQDAVEKIVAVLQDSEKQQSLLQSLTTQKDLFSTQRFMNEISKAVDSYFEAAPVS